MHDKLGHSGWPHKQASDSVKEPLGRALELANRLLDGYGASRGAQEPVDVSLDGQDRDKKTDRPTPRMLDVTLKQIVALTLLVEPRTATDLMDRLGRRNATDTLRLIVGAKNTGTQVADTSLEGLWQNLAPGRYVEPEDGSKKRGDRYKLTAQGKQLVEEIGLPLLSSLDNVATKFTREVGEVIVGSTTFLTHLALENFSRASTSITSEQSYQHTEFFATHKFIKTENTFPSVANYEVDISYGGYTPEAQQDTFLLPNGKKVALNGHRDGGIARVKDIEELRGARLLSPGIQNLRLDAHVVAANTVGIWFAKSRMNLAGSSTGECMKDIVTTRELSSVKELDKFGNIGKRSIILPQRGVIFKMICEHLEIDSSSDDAKSNVEEEIGKIGWKIGSWADDVHVAESTFLAYAENDPNSENLYAMIMLKDIYELRSSQGFNRVGARSELIKANISQSFLPMSPLGSNSSLSSTNFTLTVCATRGDDNYFDESRRDYNAFMAVLRKAVVENP